MKRYIKSTGYSEEEYEEDYPIFVVYKDDTQSADDAEEFWDKADAIRYAKENDCESVDMYTDKDGFVKVWSR